MMVCIPEPPGAKHFNDQKMISQMNHALKDFFQIITETICHQIALRIGKEQIGVENSLPTREASLSTQRLM